MEQVKFPRRQFQGSPRRQHLPGVQIQHQIAIAQPAGLCLRAPAAKDDPYLLQQHRDGEGLGHIVVDVQSKPPQLLLLAIQSGEHEDGHLGLAADQFAHAKTVDLRQQHVQQHQIEGLRMKQVQRCHAIAGCGRLITGILQIGPQQFLNVRLIFHDQYLFHASITMKKYSTELWIYHGERGDSLARRMTAVKTMRDVPSKAAYTRELPVGKTRYWWIAKNATTDRGWKT